jgi:hypothetical protein
MPITGQGWEFHVQRLGVHKRGQQARTYGSYEIFINGVSAAQSDPLLKGNICETIGPGSNDHKGVRIAQGRYQLTTQFGSRYESIGFSTNTQIAADPLMPGVALTGTGQRSAILIHPGHPAEVGAVPPVAYISSIGCFNPTAPLTGQDDINFFKSRLRVIAVINSLAAFDPDAFHKANGQPIRANTDITGAFAVVDGEPMNVLTDTVPVA